MSDQLESNPSSPQPKRFCYQQAETIEHLYLATKLADVHFAFAAPRHTRIPAHKTLLAANSDVFEKMLYDKSSPKGDVPIANATDAVFKEFLQFFYLGEVKLTAENIAGVFGLGQKYNVQKCMDACIQILKKDLTNENVCIVLANALHCAQNDVIKICELFIVLNTASLFKSADFLDCSRETLAHILKMQLLSCSEVEIFEACMAWVAAKSQLTILTKAVVKKYLDDLYYEIRFASMTMPQFCKLSSKYGPVLSKDFEAITRVIVEPDSQSSKFNKFPRHATWSAKDIVKCERALGNAQMSIQFKCKSETTFSITKPLLLGQFICGSLNVNRSDLQLRLPVDVDITEANDLNGANTKSLLKMKTQLQSMETNVVLTHPVLIRPGFFYTICIEPFPQDYGFYSNELKKDVQLDVDTKIEFHKGFVATKDKKLIGLISALFFNRI